MNTIKCITFSGVMLIASLCTTLSASNHSFVEADVKDRVISMQSSIDLKYTPEVKKRIKQYTVQQREASEQLLGRIAMYFPLFERKLRERGMPDDLKYLSVIESGLLPHAKSRVGAVGLWQFMKPTARMQGLKINRYIDERRDPEKSTDAALDYLETLYNKFGDWALAMAAYNCGPGNMRKAIRKAGSKDFWKVKKYLPRETRQYIPKFIAMSYLMNYYYTHDLEPELPHNDLLNTSTSKVVHNVNFKDISREHGVDLEVIQILNPTFIRNFIPGEGNYKLTLPTQQMMAYIQELGAEEHNMILYSHVNGMINKPAVKKRAFLEVEVLPEPEIRPALANVPNLPNHSITLPTASTMDIRNRKYTYYTMRRKQSLAQIAKLYNMPIEELMKINNFTEQQLPTPGDAIMVYSE